MATQVQEKEIRELAKKLEKLLTKVYGYKKAYFLCVGDFENPDSVADYVSNSQRETGIAWMKGTIERFESGQSIPATRDRMQ